MCQDFWNFISEDDNLYQEMIVPIDIEAKKKMKFSKQLIQLKLTK